MNLSGSLFPFSISSILSETERFNLSIYHFDVSIFFPFIIDPFLIAFFKGDEKKKLERYNCLNNYTFSNRVPLLFWDTIFNDVHSLYDSWCFFFTFPLAGFTCILFTIKIFPIFINQVIFNNFVSFGLSFSIPLE